MTIGINTITGEQSEVIKTDHNERGKTGDLGIDVDQSVDQIAKEGASTQDASSAYPNMYAFSDLNRMREFSEEFDIDPETVSMAAQNFAIEYLSEEDLTRLNDLYENPFLSKEAEIYTRVSALTHEIFSGKDGEILPERYSVAVMTILLTWNTILDSMKSHKELSEEDYQLLSRVQIGITRAISQALYEIGPNKAKVLTVILHLEIPQIEDLWGIEVNYARYEKNKPRRSFEEDPDDYIAKRAIMNAYSIVAQMIKDTYVPESKDDFVVLSERKGLPQYSDIG